LENTLTNTITVRGIEYPLVSGDAAIDPATKIIWSLLKMSSDKAYESALTTRDPLKAFQDLMVETQSSDRGSAFLFFLNLDPEIEPDPAKNPRIALENNLRKLIPTLPVNLGATELIEFINAVLPQNAETVVEEPQPEKKSRKKKGFSEKVPEVPTLEDLTGQQVTPEELAAVKTAEKLIAIPDEKLTELRPDLLTIDEQELQRALAEQQANRLTVVSTPAPPDADELEELN
jgi:hypothetical protein